ncbi:GNAT family N-acetyltransferase [Pseudomonas sp. 15FMM2]|uniref:GNAT family N-acetyltransferase n=1 Tax=Pseudomonas imrae TaxID=2992837 RepID=A0ACC7PJ97_9PSED
MADLKYRPAIPADAGDCIVLRGQTRENAFSAAELAALGITEASWSAGIRDGALPGYVACIDGEMVGYCFGDGESGEIAVLALLPHAEGKGIGKTLLDMMVAHLRQQGFERLFLACASDPKVRSYGFYRHLGWRATGERDEAGDDILELLVV